MNPYLIQSGICALKQETRENPYTHRIILEKMSVTNIEIYPAAVTSIIHPLMMTTTEQAIMNHLMVITPEKICISRNLCIMKEIRVTIAVTWHNPILDTTNPKETHGIPETKIVIKLEIKAVTK